MPDFIYFEFLIDAEFKQNFFVTRISSTNLEDVAYDLISYMQIAMREGKKMYYSYNYLSNVYFSKIRKTFQPSLDRSNEVTIAKCKEEINKLKNSDIDYVELAFTKQYNMGI